MPPEDILKANKNNFAIPNSEIIKVEAEFGGQLGQLVSLSITTTKKKYKWSATPLFPIKKNGISETKYFRNMLRLAFPDKLSIKKYF